MRLEDLSKPSISSMNDRDALTLILGIRTSRFTPTAASKKRSKAIADHKKKITPAPTFDNLSKAEQDILISRLNARRAKVNESNSASNS